jgi:hypothetical protein
MYHSDPDLPPSQLDPYYFARRQMREDQEAFTRNLSQPAPTFNRSPAQQSAHEQHKEQFLDDLSDLIWTCWYAGPIFLAGKAGLNWHELTGDAGAGVERGAQALFRWKWFQAGFFWTLVTLAIGWRVLPPALYFIPAWSIFFWLVMYVRLAEFSLFRRGPLQWAMTPATRFFHGVHSWAIVVAILLPLPACLLLAG